MIIGYLDPWGKVRILIILRGAPRCVALPALVLRDVVLLRRAKEPMMLAYGTEAAMGVVGLNRLCRLGVEG